MLRRVYGRHRTGVRRGGRADRLRVPSPRSACTASSASAVTRTSTSSPDCSTVSPRGTTSRSPRTTATTVASRGKPRSAMAHPVGRRVLGQGDLDQVGVAALELEQPDQRADRDRLLDQGGEQLGRRHRDVDAPALVEQPLVLRVVDPGHHPGHGELLLGQQRDDEVVLVVAGGRHHHVDRGQPGARRARRPRRRRPPPR